MKKFLVTALILSSLPSLATCQEAINLENAQKNDFKITKPLQKETKSLMINNEEAVKKLLLQQQKKDVEDIEMLWSASVEKNNVIKFALKKLAIPQEQRRVHTSLMSKSLAAIVSGACYLPTLTGQNSAVQSASFASARLANTLINKGSTPKEIPLTDTEIIELAGVIESLQDNIISAYYNYKSALNQLKEARSMVVLYNQNYSKAIQSNDELEMLISANLYDTVLLQEYELIQQAKKYELELVRLTDVKAVKNLSLYQYNLNQEIVNQNILGSQGEKK